MATGPAHPLSARRYPVSGNRFCKFTYLKGLHGHPVPPAAYRVLVTVLDYTNERGEMAYASVGRLAADCCMNERTVKRHLAWLREHGYLTRTKRGRRVGNVGLASEYSLALPVLQRVTADTLDDDSNVPTGDPKVSIGDPKVSIGVPQGVTADTPSDPVSDPFTSDPFTSGPGDDVCPFGNEAIRRIDDDPGWDNALTRGMEDGTDETPPQEFHSMAEWNRIEQAKAAAESGPHPFQANTIGTEPNTFADAEYDDTEAFYAFAAERESA